MLRAVVELALSVARAGEEGDPPVPAPSGLRRFYAFSRLPPAAVEQVVRVLDSDDEFRARVAEAALEDALGRLGWVWLTRRDAWEIELAGLVAEADSLAASERVRRVGRRAERANEVAASVTERAERRRREAEQDAEQARTEVTNLRRVNRTLETELATTSSEVARLDEERVRAVRQLKGVEALLTERGTELRRVREEADRLRVALDRARADAAAAELAILPPALATPSASSRPISARDSALPAARALDLEPVSRAVQNAAAAAAALATSLAAAATALAGAGPRVTAPTLQRREADKHRRSSPRLPAGLIEDTPAALDHAARQRGAIVLVDGYNVSKMGWPDLDLATQRLRLAKALVDLKARTGARVELVFDGADEERLWARSLPAVIGVRFSPPDIEADDVLLEMVDELPVTCPIVVISSDRRVRDGARSRGALSISSAALVSLAKGG